MVFISESFAETIHFYEVYSHYSFHTNLISEESNVFILLFIFSLSQDLESLKFFLRFTSVTIQTTILKSLTLSSKCLPALNIDAKSYVFL